MKKIKLSIGSTLVTCTLIISCVSVKGFEQPFTEQHQFGKEGNSVFVIKKTGQKIVGKTIAYSKTSVWRVRDKENWISIDGNKIDIDEIDRVQSETSYRASFPLPSNPTGVFIDRIRHGKISLYYYEHRGLNNGTDIRGDYHVYVFEKENSGLGELTYANFASALQDNSAAMNLLKELYPKGKVPMFNEKGNLKNFIQIVELYNK